MPNITFLSNFVSLFDNSPQSWSSVRCSRTKACISGSENEDEDEAEIVATPVMTFGDVGESNPKWDSLPLTTEIEEVLPGRPPFNVLTEGRFRFVGRPFPLLPSVVDSTPLVSGLVRLVRVLEELAVPSGGETFEEVRRWFEPVSDSRCPGAGIVEEGTEVGL